jgi:Fis family transcriptional regulator, factor for inversion stimulation protein
MKTVEILSIDRSKIKSQNSNQNQNQSLRECLKHALENRFANLDGYAPANLYDLVLEGIEPPLLEAVLKSVKGNQCKSAVILGISRGTLRKKLQNIY